jgi:hypothetical protein
MAQQSAQGSLVVHKYSWLLSGSMSVSHNIDKGASHVTVVKLDEKAHLRSAKRVAEHETYQGHQLWPEDGLVYQCLSKKYHSEDSRFKKEKMWLSRKNQKGWEEREHCLQHPSAMHECAAHESGLPEPVASCKVAACHVMLPGEKKMNQTLGELPEIQRFKKETRQAKCRRDNEETSLSSESEVDLPDLVIPPYPSQCGHHIHFMPYCTSGW